MWGDYQVDDPNTLTQAQKDKLINQAKLIAGITAVFAGEDVNVAAGVAAEAVQNNALVKSDDIKNFYL
ncbi:VENN motif pre-toxin domain-containing protein, partial [Moraxella catarrhalis]